MMASLRGKMSASFTKFLHSERHACLPLSWSSCINQAVKQLSVRLWTKGKGTLTGGREEMSMWQMNDKASMLQYLTAQQHQKGVGDGLS